MSDLTSPHLTALVAQGEALKKALEENQNEIHAETERLIFKERGYRLGSIVESRGKIFQIAGFDHQWAGYYWVIANKQKKDGTFGFAQCRLYSGVDRVIEP